MISMMPPGMPGATTPWTRQRTMYMSVPQLTGLLQGDDVDAAKAAQAELDARGLNVPTQSVDQLSGPMLPAGALAQVANGQAMPGGQGFPGNVGAPGNRPSALPNVPPPQRAAQNSGAEPQIPDFPPGALPPPPNPEQAIQKGIEQADTAQDPLAGMSPALKQTAAQMAAASSDPQQSSAVNDIVKSLSGYSANPNLAIAKAGFAMAASRSPFFFGALGEGANAGIDEYQRQQEQALLEKAKAAGLIQQQQQFGEQVRSNTVNEQQAGQRIQQAAQDMQLRQQEYQEKVREYNAGFATEQELKQAQINAQNASAAYQSIAAQEGAKRTQLMGVGQATDDQGNLIKTNLADNSATKMLDENGQPVKAMKFGTRPNVAQTKQQILEQAGWSPQEIADAFSGKKPMDPGRIEQIALKAGADAALTSYDPVQQQQLRMDEYNRVKGILTAGQTPSAAATAPGAAASGAATPGNAPAAAPATQPPGQPAAPTYSTPDEVKAAYKAGKLSKPDAIQALKQFGQ